MFWRNFSKQEMRALLLRLRKGRLLLSQQDEHQEETQEKQKQKPADDRHEPYASWAPSQWAAKNDPRQSPVHLERFVAGPDRRPAAS